MNQYGSIPHNAIHESPITILLQRKETYTTGMNKPKYDKVLLYFISSFLNTILPVVLPFSQKSEPVICLSFSFLDHTVTSVRGVQVDFNNLNVTVDEKCILKDVNGYALPGQLLAIMGPSGK